MYNQYLNSRIQIASYLYKRNSSVLKRFIIENVEEGNNIITDRWTGYNFLDHPGSKYIRIVHNNGAVDFGFGFISTSHIEGLWSHLKEKNKIYWSYCPFQK